MPFLRQKCMINLLPEQTAKMFFPHSYNDKVNKIVIIYSFYMVRELLLSPLGRIVRSSASVKITCLLTKL